MSLPTISANNPFAGYISQIDAISIEDVVGEARFGSAISFRDARGPLQLIKEFTAQMRFLDSTGLTSGMIANPSSAFQRIINSVQQIRSFGPQNYGNQNLANSMVQELRIGYDSLVEAAVPVLLYSEFRASGISNTKQKTHELLAEVENQRKELGDLVSESKELLAGQKKFSAEIAIAGYGTLFANEAQEHADAAKIWLCATGILAILTASAGVWNYLVSESLIKQFSQASASQVSSIPASLSIQFTIAKVILFAIGLSAAYWSARVYRSHRHNAIVNRHRANALTSFQEFVVSSTDPDVRNAVLLQTTSCIYSPQPTGFSSGNDTDGDSPLKVLEIVRNLQK
jgi:hypothetical protein